MKQGKAKRQTNTTALNVFSGLYTYIYCMLVSREVMELPIYGGALYLCAQSMLLFVAIYQRPRRAYLTPMAQRLRLVGLGLIALMSALVIIVMPTAFSSPRLWILFLMIAVMLVRDAIGQRLVTLSLERGLSEGRFIALLALTHLLALGGVLWIFLYNVGGLTGWELLGGYAVCDVLALYSLLKDRWERRAYVGTPEPEQARSAAASVRSTNAFRTYEAIYITFLTAITVTLVLLYSFLALTAEELLIGMVLAVLGTLIPAEIASLLLRRRTSRKREPDATGLLIFGLFLWLYGIYLFSRELRGASLSMPNIYVAMGICSGGASCCAVAVSHLENIIGAVARLTETDRLEMRRVQETDTWVALLLGEVLALAGLVALCFVAQKLPSDPAELATRIQPILVIPPVLTVLTALLCAFRFPVNLAYEEKLARLLRLQEKGEDNPALEKQVHQVVVTKHRQPFGTSIVKAIIRPLYQHKLKDADHIHPDDQNPIIFLCNHGVTYGPVVCSVYLPVYFRPWVVSEITVDKEEAAAYIYRYSIEPIPWLPKKLGVWAGKMIGRMAVWCMTQMESIPVYRNEPAKLMRTFRESVEAMQAGDNLLIFPENPNAEEDNPGYKVGEMGELYSGFALIAPIYYSRTGKCARFLPIFAHRGSRTLCFGTEIVYNPDADRDEEEARIAREASEQMHAMCEREDRLLQEKKEQKKKKR